MADNSGISWCDATWNPTTGCDRVSAGCANCYALTLAPRLQKMAKQRGPTDPYMRDGDPKTSGPGFGLMMHPGRLDQPIRWKRPRRIFVNSMSDLFHPEVTDQFIAAVWAVMESAPQHTFQVLTKRPERMRSLLTPNFYAGLVRKMGYDALGNQYRANNPGWPLPNVWLGTSVENARFRDRIDHLRETPAVVRFLSCEPLLGPLVCPQCKGWGYDVEPDPSDPTGQTPMQVQCRRHFNGHDLDLRGIHWVIVGGESGPGARMMDPEWARDIRNACDPADAAFFMKQMGEVWSNEVLHHGGHGADLKTFPRDLQVQEYPDAEDLWSRV